MKFDLSALFRKPSTTAIISIVLAVVGWFVVVYSISPSDKTSIAGVPVQINMPATSDLNVVEGKNLTVTVNVEGMSYNIGNLRAQDIVLRAIVSDVTRPGTYELSVEAVRPLDNRYEVTSIYPETISVTFDREITRNLIVEQDIIGLSVPDENYMLGDISIEPGTITVQGPEKEVERISRVVVHREFAEPLTTSQTLDLPLVFLDSFGNEIKTRASGEGYLTPNYASTTVHIPVMEVVELPLTLSFVNVPEDFPQELLKYSISNETITVAATEDIISRYYEIPVGYIDLSNLDLLKSSSVTFDVELPDNMVNTQNIESVVVEFSVQELNSKTVKLRDITAINVPPNYEAQIKSSVLSVRLIGDKEILDSLLPESIVAEVDFSSQEVAVGQYPMPVRIYMPGDDFVWAIGKYNAVVSVVEK